MKKKTVKKAAPAKSFGVPRPKKAAVSCACSPCKSDFENAVALIRSDLSILRKEMNEKFEKHENIILAEYRHRIEDLEGRVRKLMEK
ncbi:MAG: hypothetical protein WC878_01355 [Candidatus Paceibacterota bacterium]|jgi:hypothetical protein